MLGSNEPTTAKGEATDLASSLNTEQIAQANVLVLPGAPPIRRDDLPATTGRWPDLLADEPNEDAQVMRRIQTREAAQAIAPQASASDREEAAGFLLGVELEGKLGFTPPGPDLSIAAGGHLVSLCTHSHREHGAGVPVQCMQHVAEDGMPNLCRSIHAAGDDLPPAGEDGERADTCCVAFQ